VPEPKPFLTPGGSAFRHAVERRSAIVAVFLHRLPRAVPGLIVVGLVATGLLAPPVVSGVVLLVVAALLLWLVFLSWPAIPAQARALRTVVIAIVVAYALSRFF
jgi:hypothetical protein